VVVRNNGGLVVLRVRACGLPRAAHLASRTSPSWSISALALSLSLSPALPSGIPTSTPLVLEVPFGVRLLVVRLGGHQIALV